MSPDARPAVPPPSVEPVAVRPPQATYGITKEGLTVWLGGSTVLRIPRDALPGAAALPGIALRCLVA